MMPCAQSGAAECTGLTLLDRGGLVLAGKSPVNQVSDPGPELTQVSLLMTQAVHSHW